MPIEDGEYIPRSREEITQALETELRDEFGANIDLTQSSVFRSLVDVIAAVAAENQETALEDVYQAAFLETAEGADLDRVVDLVGIQRRDAIHATGVQQFTAPQPVESNYPIQRGTVLQTSSDEPIEFETTERSVLSLHDDFESGNVADYSGDTEIASVDSTAPYQDDNHLTLGTSEGHIYNGDTFAQRGSTNHVWVRPTAVGTDGAVPAVTFSVDPNNPSYYYQIVLDTINEEVRLERVEAGSVEDTIDTITGVSFTSGTYYEVEFRHAITTNISVTVYDGDSEIATLGGDDSTFLSGAIGFKSLDSNAEKYFDLATQSQVSANIRAAEGGIRGNVGANTIQTLPSPPSGVQDTRNLYPVGDPNYLDTDGLNFNNGTERESDDELRERAKDAVTEGGKATFDALVSTLVNDVEDVSSVTLYENKTSDDNTGSGGLPPHSFEAVVYGGDSLEIARALFETKCVTSRDYAGVNGTEVTETVVAESNGQEFTVRFSRPTAVNIDMTLDLIVNDKYIGDDALRDRIVNYVGGTTTENTTVEGLGVSENVIIDQVQDLITGPNDTGVVALDYSVDGSPIEATPSITTVDGVRVIEVGQNEVAQADGTNGSITINTREQ